jgi:hypothetical protein
MVAVEVLQDSAGVLAVDVVLADDQAREMPLDAV